MSRLATIGATFALLASLGCGFLDNARVFDYYNEHVVPEDKVALLATWPFHGAMLAACALLDQAARTVESAAPAGRDAYDYLVLPVNDDNIMLHRTVIVPKTLATPFVFLWSYATRWLLPISPDERPRFLESYAALAGCQTARVHCDGRSSPH